MNFDHIIIGQGICGTFLSWNLSREGKKILVIDEPRGFSSTKVASGIINPVTGRRVVTTWMIEELLPFDAEAYRSIGETIGETVFSAKDIVVFPASRQMAETYEKRSDEADAFVHRASGLEADYKEVFHFHHLPFVISPAYLVFLHPLLAGWRKQLAASGSLLEERFEESQLEVRERNVRYKNHEAANIIYCNGVDAYQSPYWKNLPFVYNKGQALIADIPGLSTDRIYKYGSVTIAPWYHNLWWIGSSYENDFDTPEPTEAFYNSTVASLQNILKIPFSIQDRLAGLRPAVIERRPFVGMHPNHPAIGIFDGMGTKGCSLAPYFAQQLTQNLLQGKPVDALADVQRFHRLMSR